MSSKKSDVLERNLSAIGLNHLIIEAVGSDQVSAYKPNPEGIHTIVQRYNLNSKQTVYIGDSTFDVEMAQRAGVQSAAVTWVHMMQDHYFTLIRILLLMIHQKLIPYYKTC